MAFPHGGDNYEWRDDKQLALHHALVEAGADLVLGHGSHMAQEIECYQGRWVLHGLGNCVLNSPGRYARLGQHSWSLIAALHAEPRPGGFRLELRLYPILSDNQVTGYQPRLATLGEARSVGDLLRRHSNGLTTADLQPLSDAWGWHLRLDLGSRLSAVPGSKVATALVGPGSATVE